VELLLIALRLIAEARIGYVQCYEHHCQQRYDYSAADSGAGRNEKSACGSGQKYKPCCGKRG
jgi:uncharacterized protein YchJ